MDRKQIAIDPNISMFYNSINMVNSDLYKALKEHFISLLSGFEGSEFDGVRAVNFLDNGLLNFIVSLNDSFDRVWWEDMLWYSLVDSDVVLDQCNKDRFIKMILAQYCLAIEDILSDYFHYDGVVDISDFY
jgi:hypothetical protein